MILHSLIETRGGKEKIIMIDELPKINIRLKSLKSSQRGKKVEYRVEKSEEKTKFKKKSTAGREK